MLSPSRQNEVTLVFIHGFLGSQLDFSPLISHLEDTFSCVAVALPGHDASPLGENSLYSSIKDLFLDQIFPLKNPLLVGYSLGGRIAMRISQEFPHHVKGCIAISSHPGLETAKQKKERIEVDAKWIQYLEANSMKDFIKKWYAQPMFQPLSPEIIKRREQISSEVVVRYLQELSPVALPSQWRDLQHFPIPLSFLFGSLDEKYGKVHRRVQKILGSANSLLIKQSGHALHIDNPGRCASGIRSLIRNRFMARI